jgi:hypothetical protein
MEGLFTINARKPENQESQICMEGSFTIDSCSTRTGIPDMHGRLIYD